MLTELHIENLGVIEQATLVLDGGVTALTGETGAGKTMLVEAIELLVGGRADPSIVRAGTAEARIDGRLTVTGPDGDDEYVLTRVVPATGRSRAYVNGRPATATTLAEITAEVVDLHGQHAHQSLLSVAAQRAALDEFGEIDLNPLRDARARLTELDAELAALGGDERARAREIDLLRFQVQELDAAAIGSADEDDLLAREETLLADAVAHREAGARALDALRGESGAGDDLSAAVQALGERDPYVALIERLHGVVADLDDVIGELRDLAEGIEEDPSRLEAIRQRRQQLSDLRRKYGDDLGEVLAFHAETAARLRELEEYDERAAELDTARQAAMAHERQAAAEVARQRREAAPILATAVEQRIRDLAMPNASISIAVGSGPDDGPGDDGPGDDVRFMLSANPGGPLLPLHRVASGGELARAMLALRLVLSRAGDAEAGQGATLVFDEVDAGIGGSAAAAVGGALADLGALHQVLIVTHLPQVAACATRQLVVEKVVHGDATFTSVDLVEGDDRVAEIARMLSGTETNASLRHARDLLDR